MIKLHSQPSFTTTAIQFVEVKVIRTSTTIEVLTTALNANKKPVFVDSRLVPKMTAHEKKIALSMPKNTGETDAEWNERVVRPYVLRAYK